MSWLEAVREVVAAVQRSDVTDLELSSCEFSLRLRRELSPVVSTDAALAAAADGYEHVVAAPFTGVFYRSPTPAARPYVTDGDWVDAHAVIGLLETMKIFNEVSADVSGRIVRFLADNGQLVHAGDGLVAIEPGERATAAPEPHP